MPPTADAGETEGRPPAITLAYASADRVSLRPLLLLVAFIPVPLIVADVSQWAAWILYVVTNNASGGSNLSVNLGELAFGSVLMLVRILAAAGLLLAAWGDRRTGNPKRAARMCLVFAIVSAASLLTTTAWQVVSAFNLGAFKSGNYAAVYVLQALANTAGQSVVPVVAYLVLRRAAWATR